MDTSKTKPGATQNGTGAEGGTAQGVRPGARSGGVVPPANAATPNEGGGQWRNRGGAAGGGGQWRGGGGGMGMGGGSMRSRGLGGHYIVFVDRNGKPTAVNIKTGLTDLDYVEVVEGLNEGEKVIVLPSASLVNSQKEMRERIQRMTGGGGIPGMQQQQQGSGQKPTQR